MKRALALLLLTATAHADPDPLVVNNCLQCHEEELLAQQRLTDKQWTAVVKKMQGWGAPIEPENFDALVKILAATYGKDEWKPARVEASAVAALFAPLPDGKLAHGNLDQGRLLYAKACLQCHGADGHGSPTGMNLADRPLLSRAADFARAVRKGRGRMPSFPFGNGELAALLAYLRSL
jgi:mono/diheme cytochrome c family protein